MPPAATYDELKGAIARAYPEMSKQLQRIARFALDRPSDLALGTVAALAEATQVQPSAMIRFANALGYGGFSQMQQIFRNHLVERSGSYRERIEQMRRSGERPAGASEAVLHRLVGDAVAELGRLEDSVRAADLRAAVALLAAAPRIHVLAQRRAFPVACYIAYALSQLELNATLLDGVGGMLRESLRTIAGDDVLIVASFRNYSADVVEAAQTCHRDGIGVLAITDGPLSPLSRFARVCFELGDDSRQPFRSLVAPLCLSQALVVATGHWLAEQPRADRGRRGASRTNGQAPARRSAARSGSGADR